MREEQLDWSQSKVILVSIDFAGQRAGQQCCRYRAACENVNFQSVYALFCFVVALYIYMLRDLSGFIASIPSATTTQVYFLSSGNSSVFVNVTLMCDDTFTGNIEVTFCLMRVFLECLLQTKLDGQGRARREAARRRKSECKVNLDILNSCRSSASKRLQKLYPRTRGVQTCVSLQRTSTSGVSICAQ